MFCVSLFTLGMAILIAALAIAVCASALVLELIFYVLLFTLGMAILTPALAIAVCASALVLVADDLITIKLQNMTNRKRLKTLTTI